MGIEVRLPSGIKRQIRLELGASRRELEDQKMQGDLGFANQKLLKMFDLTSQELAALDEYWRLRRSRLDGLSDDDYFQRSRDFGYKFREMEMTNGLQGGLRFLEAIFDKRY